MSRLGSVRSKLLWVIALAAVATFVLWLVAIFALNRSAKYGKINIPGSAVLQLPAGEVDLALDAQVTNFGGSSNVSLPIPNLNVSVVPVGGGLIPGYESSAGSTTSVNSDAHRRFAKLDIPAAGRYRVTISGDVGGFIEPTLELGAPGLATEFLITGASVVFLLALIYTLSGLLLPRPSPAGDSMAQASAAFGKGQISHRPLPWVALGIEVVGAAGLLFLLFGTGSFQLPPQGRVDASGQVVSGSPSISSGSGNPLTSPLPTPTAADTVAADSAASLFREANLAKALNALTGRIGAKGDIALMAIYPGELDLVQDASNGSLHRVRVALDGTVTIGPGVPTQTGPPVIYVDQINPSLVSAIEQQLTREYNITTRQLAAFELNNSLPNSTPGWDVKTVTRGGHPGPTFQVQLDGTGLQRLS